MLSDERKSDRLGAPLRSQFMESLRKALYVLGSALVVFVALRNSLHWHVQRLWGASGSFWQGAWDWCYATMGHSYFIMSVMGAFIVSFSVFWLFNGVLLMLDKLATTRLHFLLRYKIQADKNVPVDPTKLRRAIKVVLFNQIVVGIPFMLLVSQLFQWRGCPVADDLPSFQWTVLEIAVFSLCYEVFFYYSHRMFHTAYLYKWIHKVHHEWTAPIGIVSLYAHPVEHVMSNLFPGIVGPLIMGSHLSSTIMWFCMALISTSIAHSGYHFPLLPSPEAHDYHHLKFINNFGVLGVLDRLHGTDTLFRRNIAYKRHFLLFSMLSVREVVPDVKERCPAHEALSTIHD